MRHKAPKQPEMSRTMPAERTHASSRKTPTLGGQGAANGDEPACPHVKDEHTAYMVDTLAVFQLPTFWLKATPDWNICAQAPLHAPQSPKAARYEPNHAGRAHTCSSRKTPNAPRLEAPPKGD